MVDEKKNDIKNKSLKTHVLLLLHSDDVAETLQYILSLSAVLVGRLDKKSNPG